MTKPVIIVQGGQWGSEAKGAIASYLGHHHNVEFAVRTGTINAGHTVYYQGRPFKMQQLPVGWTNPNTRLVIGPGAYVHMPTLQREIAMIRGATGRNPQVFVDYRVGVHLDGHSEAAQVANRHHSIGTTGKGCSEAVMDRVAARDRKQNGTLLRTWPQLAVDSVAKWGIDFCDTTDLLVNAWGSGYQLLLEGTQGSHLDLLLGPYPFTTHKPTQASQWVVEAGLPLTISYEVVLVVRTFPIRVAGNSGPMPLEISWPWLAHHINQAQKDHGNPPLVSPGAITLFESILAEAPFDHPPSLGLNEQHMWSPEDREKYRVSLSEANKWAWDKLDDANREHLEKLFERTTVTNKLRRVADWGNDTVRESVKWNRPTYLALTFLNYWEPWHWGTRVELAHRNRRWLLDAPEAMDPQLAKLVRLVTTGPEDDHVHRVGKVVRKGQVLWAESTKPDFV